MLAFLNTYAHEHIDIRFVWDFFFCPEVRVLKGKGGGIPSNLAFCSSRVRKAFRLQGYINPSLLFVFFDNGAVSAFAALSPMENIIPCSGNQFMCTPAQQAAITYWGHHFFVKGEGDVGTVVLVVGI